MKNFLPSFFLSFTLFLGFLSAGAQGINTVSVQPANPLVCNPISVTSGISLWCANATVQSSSNTVVGSIIYVNVNINQPFICLPAIVSINQTHTLTNVTAGNFRLTVRTYLNGVLNDTMSMPLAIASCCQVNTNFNLTSTAVCPGDSVTFTSTNTNLLNYDWKLDGSPLQGGVTAGSRFGQAGTYRITLVGNDSTCRDSTEKTVRVAGFPIIAFTSPVMENCPGSMDAAVNTSVSGGFGSYTYNWSTGDTIPDLNRVAGGTYVLTVTDSIGCASTDTITLMTGAPVVASFIPSKTTQICPGETLSFTNSGANASNFSWKIDGQQFSQTNNAMYTFNDTGNFSIRLYADDGPACADSFSMRFQVSGPTADFTSSAPTRACPDEEIMLTNNSLAASLYSWTSGGIPFSTARNAAISFSQQNTYDITLIASDGNCSDTATSSVNVSAPTATFSSSKMSPLCPGDFSVLTNTSTNNINNWWSANGTQFSTNGNAVYTFNDPGTVGIKLVIKDDRCFDSTSMTFDVNALPAVVPDVQDETCEGDNDGSINLTVSGGVPPFTYDWSNGSSMQDLMNLTAGTFDITIRDSDGCEWSDTYVITTKGGLTANYSTKQVSNGVQFTDMSDSTAVSWNWDFGDGSSSTSQSPLHNFAFNGKYIICLIASDRFGCSDTICDTLDVATSLWEAFEAGLSFYPNPAEEAIYLDLAALRGKAVRIYFHDQLGRKIKTMHIRAEEKVRLDISSLPSAVYIISVESEAGRLMGKVVKR